MNPSNWKDEALQWKAFVETPVGAAFEKFERLHGFAWQKDTELGMDGLGKKTAKEAWKKSDEARAAFLKLLGYPAFDPDATAKSADPVSVDAPSDIQPSDHQEGESPSANEV